jgi:hypothetical protein
MEFDPSVACMRPMRLFIGQFAMRWNADGVLATYGRALRMGPLSYYQISSALDFKAALFAPYVIDIVTLQLRQSAGRTQIALAGSLRTLL